MLNNPFVLLLPPLGSAATNDSPKDTHTRWAATFGHHEQKSLIRFSLLSCCWCCNCRRSLHSSWHTFIQFSNAILPLTLAYSTASVRWPSLELPSWPWYSSGCRYPVHRCPSRRQTIPRRKRLQRAPASSRSSTCPPSTHSCCYCRPHSASTGAWTPFPGSTRGRIRETSSRPFSTASC